MAKAAEHREIDQHPWRRASPRRCARSRPGPRHQRSRPPCTTGSAATFTGGGPDLGCAGRVIVTGMGKSGHVGAQDRRHARLDRHAGLVRSSRRSEPWRPRHDHGRRRYLALSWSGETAELKNLIDYSRRFRIGLIAITATPTARLAGPPTSCWPCRRRAKPARTTCAHDLDADAARARRRLAIALLESRGFTARRFRGPPSRRPARREC